MKKLVFALSVAFISSINIYTRDWGIDVVVAKDGSGDFTSITDALANYPAGDDNYVIYIKEGVYNEKIFITKDNITLLGQDRDNTIITQAILRRIFRESNDSDWGVATINIDDHVSGLTLANLTVRNNFADLNPEVPDNNDHTMAIRGGGDKVIIVNCNIVATGGDTLSLWNTSGGRFYHSACYFEGYVDYVCPRGFCYISNSDFYGFNSNASIWHDGSGGKDHKLVVRNSRFDGIRGFGLGRFHRMSAFYLLDCQFSVNINNNGGILYVGDSLSQDRDKLVYGVRTYYNNCNRDTDDYEWHKDNLVTAENSPSSDEITDAWTFNNTWNPEKEIQGLLECAFLPKPACYSGDVESNPALSWIPGRNAMKHVVYLGTDSVPEFLTETPDTIYRLKNQLKSATQYFWRVDVIKSSGDTVPGRLWTFFTKVTDAPAQVYDPYPPVDTNYSQYRIHLKWSAHYLEVDSFYVWFGSEEHLELLSRQVDSEYYLFNLDEDSTYYWRVDAKNNIGITRGPLWYFNYKPAAGNSVDINKKSGRFSVYPNPVGEELIIDFDLKHSQKIKLVIYNLLGQPIYTNDLGLVSALKYTHSINFDKLKSSIPDNICLVSIEINNSKEVIKLVVE